MPMPFPKARERIESLESFDDVIKRIDALNILLLEALAERSRYPVARNYFDYHNNDKPTQRELEAQGFDTIWWSPVYSKIVERICKEGDFVKGTLEKLLEAELEFEEIVYERSRIGTKVVEYKAPRGMAITRREREEQIIQKMRGLAAEYDLDPDDVEWIFRFIIQKNKDIQHCHKQCNPSLIKLEEIQSRRVWQIRPYEQGDGSDVDKLREAFQSTGRRLEEETGYKHFAVVKKIGSGSYEVVLVKDS